MKRISLLILILIPALASFAYAEKKITIEEECVYLDELTASGIPHTKVTCGIGAGETKFFPKEVIENYLRRAGITAKVMNDVAVIRKGEKLSEDEIKSYAEFLYKEKYPDLKIVIDQIRLPKNLYAENQEDFTIDIDTGKFGANYAEVKNGVKRSQVYIYVRAFQEGFVTIERIKPGETLADKVRPESIEVTNMRSPLVTNPTGIVSSKTISKGRPVTADMTRQKPALAKGESVKLIYDKGGIKIETTGIVEENAFVGKPVSVRNSSSQKVVSANYIGNGVAIALF